MAAQQRLGPYELPQATMLDQIEALLRVPTGGDSPPEVSSIDKTASETRR